MFGRETKKVTIDVKEEVTIHVVEAFGNSSAVSQAMTKQGIKECCRATVESTNGSREVFIGVQKIATLGIKSNARSTE